GIDVEFYQIVVHFLFGENWHLTCGGIMGELIPNEGYHAILSCFRLDKPFFLIKIEMIFQVRKNICISF
ncbi:MAG: hypothetical protein FWC50_08075, partial [Planctomycetaceae bacterium]|nr:hypothetical protein [Planctomycetaceae bacterium]